MKLVFIMQVAMVGALTGQTPQTTYVQGRVLTSKDSAPSVRATASLLDESFGVRRRIGKVETNENGGFRFDKLAGGVYTLYVEQTGFLSEYVTRVEPGRPITVRLRRSASISGQVLGVDGKGILGAVVEIGDLSYMYGDAVLLPVSMAFAYTDDHGKWRIAGLAPRRYLLRTSCNGYDTVLYPNASGLDGASRIELHEGSEMEGIEFRLSRGPRFSLQGQLIDSRTEAPAQAKFLRAYSADPIVGTSVDGTLRDGEFRLEGLKPGRYFLNFHWVGPTNDVVRSAVFPVEVGNADRRGLTLRAAQKSVAGRIVVGDHPLPCCLSVYLEPKAAIVRAKVSGSGGGSAVASDGSYEIVGVQSGEYSLRVHSVEPAHYFVRERTVIVDGSRPITGVNLELDFSAATMAGRALDVKGFPIADAWVVLRSIEPEKRTNELYQRVYRTGSTGSYSITDVAPGDYLLFACRGMPEIGDPEFFEYALRRARHVTVPPRAVLTEDASELLTPAPQP